MSKQVSPGQLESFIGLFYRVNSTAPKSRPTPDGYGNSIDRLVITRGRLQVVTLNGMIDILIPDEEVVDETTYQERVPMLTKGLTDLLQVPHYTRDIQNALEKDGLSAVTNGRTMMFNPLTQGLGEVDLQYSQEEIERETLPTDGTVYDQPPSSS